MFSVLVAGIAHREHLLTEQTKKCHPNFISWNPKLIQDFEDLKSWLRLAKRPVLKLVDYSLPFIVQTGGSSVAISGVLLQPHNGVNHPVYYVSRKLLPREQNYLIAEIEALAVVYSLDKFKYYLDSRKFTLYVDSTYVCSRCQRQTKAVSHKHAKALWTTQSTRTTYNKARYNCCVQHGTLGMICQLRCVVYFRFPIYFLTIQTIMDLSTYQGHLHVPMSHLPVDGKNK